MEKKDIKDELCGNEQKHPQDKKWDEDIDDDDQDYEDMKNEAEQNMVVEYYEGDEDPLEGFDDGMYAVDGLQIGGDEVNMEQDTSSNLDQVDIQIKQRKDLVKTSPLSTFETAGEIYSIDINEHKAQLIFGDGEETLYIYDLNTYTQLSKQKTAKDSIISTKFSKDKTCFLAASMDGIINIYSSETLELISMIEDSKDDEILWTDWHPKGSVFAFGVVSGAVYIYSKQGENIMSLYGHAGEVTSGCFSLDGKILLTVANDCLKIWELKNKAIKYTVNGFKYHKGEILCLGIGKYKSLVATGSSTNEIGLVNYDTGSVAF